jgi:hypothetical protein
MIDKNHQSRGHGKIMLLAIPTGKPIYIDPQTSMSLYLFVRLFFNSIGLNMS